MFDSRTERRRVLAIISRLVISLIVPSSRKHISHLSRVPISRSIDEQRALTRGVPRAPASTRGGRDRGKSFRSGRADTEALVSTLENPLGRREVAPIRGY